ncbi:MAG: hypothetical protein SF052_10900 [Bacteroidia bacterium]|nr:hypothetical protein [Bacteroidia bacterium]
MKKTFVLITIALVAGLASCTVSEKAIIPLSEEIKIEDTYTIIWNGTSKAYRYEEGQWERAENYDYQFSVIQKRYDSIWKSVKNLHRQHPDYDGKAGERNQTMYFELAYQLEGDHLICDLNASLGRGKGVSDQEFRKQTLDFTLADVSRFSPYDHIRITQTYKYEEGILQETVLLYKKSGAEEIPFMKNEEQAFFYVKGKTAGAPTVFRAER